MLQRVNKQVGNRRCLERPTKDGDSPVGEISLSLVWYLSTAGPVEPRRNLGRPFSKAKYY